MDERNERLVFDRIVRSCCSSGTEGGEATTAPLAQKPQYFLVSPKLLEGLRAMDNEDVTVLLVWNGPGVTSKWQLGDIKSALLKRKASIMPQEEADDNELEPAKTRQRKRK
jgi:hypothetical protein